jgi:hypothetical protein
MGGGLGGRLENVLVDNLEMKRETTLVLYRMANPKWNAKYFFHF